MNAGLDCWYKCEGKQGVCAWCGDGMCCKKGYHDTRNGCDGSFGGNTRHECVTKPTGKHTISKSDYIPQDYIPPEQTRVYQTLTISKI